MTSTKLYWSTLKISCIPPLNHQNKYITDFKEKEERFNSFFDEQCFLINNSSHGTIIRTGITCKKIHCYMRDSAYSWFIVKKVKVF